MTRGVAHPPELRAQVLAAVLAGMSIADASRQFNLDMSVVYRWVTSDARIQRAPEYDLGEMIIGLIATHVTTIQAQLQAASDRAWLERQTAAELAQLVAVERDTTIRLLAGLRPVDDQPSLEPPGPAEASRSAADDL